MTSWKTYRLGDICTLNYGKALTATNRVAGDIPVYSSAGITGSHNVALVQSKGIIVGRKGSVGTVYYSDKPFYCIDTAYYILPNDEKYDFKWLYYRLKSLHLDKLNEDSAVPGLNRETAYAQEFPLPPLAEQRRIAGILGAIDDKIENNRRINTNLELQAQALYKQWFVDNRKDDWEEKQLGEIALHITDGVHNTVIDSPNGEYYLLSCKNIKSGSLLIGSNERRIDHETFTKLRKRTRLSQGDILVTSVGTVGEMYLVNESPTNYEFQRSVAIIKPNNDIISSYFLYAALLYQQNEIKHLAHGAVQQCIFISDLKEYSLIVPNKDDISAFDAVIAPMFNKIGELQKENENLATLRDTLLPKLMNGEIKL
ncbi:MAG: restriction endonuclease subunit S [Rikenellaceae bacterium]|nr:restriction endonuclease subunit S [Rikenellaceae bacterium]